MHEIFRKRKSTRRFEAKEIEQEKLDDILEAAESAPSAGNLRARDVRVVTDEGTKEKLAESAFGQDFIAAAPLVLVFSALPEQSAQKYGQRGRNLYASQDATLAASFAWLQAVMLGLSGCWVGGFDTSGVKEVLDLDGERIPIAILPLGYSKH